MQQQWNVSSMPKTSSFQMRINPEVKKQGGRRLCQLWTDSHGSDQSFHSAVHQCGRSSLSGYTEQQGSSAEQAAAVLMAELRRGETSVQNEDDWDL